MGELVLFALGIGGGFISGYLLGLMKKNEVVMKALKEVEYTATQDYWNSLKAINHRLDK